MVASELMAMHPAIARQNGRGVRLYNQLPATVFQISSLQRRRYFISDDPSSTNKPSVMYLCPWYTAQCHLL